MTPDSFARPGHACANCLPAPKDGEFSLYVRTYWPKKSVVDGKWAPPPVVKTC